MCWQCINKSTKGNKAMDKQGTRGGWRPNSGRKPTGRDVTLNVKISKEAADKLEQARGLKNKSEYIDWLLLQL